MTRICAPIAAITSEGSSSVTTTSMKPPTAARFLVMHGDEFDVVVRYVKWLAALGDWAYRAALGFNMISTGCAAGPAGRAGRCPPTLSIKSKRRSIT